MSTIRPVKPYKNNKQLEEIVQELIRQLGLETFDCETVYGLLTSLADNIYIDTVDPEIMHIVNKIFELIYHLSKIEKEQIFSNGKEQSLVKVTLYDLLRKMSLNNYHMVNAPCKNLKDGVCGMCNPVDSDRNHIFKCDKYHMESLIVHSFCAALINCIYSIDNKDDFKSTFLKTVAGLFHDIGKMETVSTHDVKSKLIIAFPAHGEAGYIIWLKMWTPVMNKFISKENYENIGKAIGTHMCGYHDPTGESSDYKLSLLGLFNSPETNKILITLVVGDTLGKQEEVPKPFSVESQQAFIDGISEPVTFDNFRKKFNFKKPVVIFPIGRSGAGKSTLAEQISRSFSTYIVSRDRAITFVCVDVDEELSKEAYFVMYEIYKAGKLLKKNATKENVKRYIQAQINWNEFIVKEGLPYKPIELYNGKDPLDIVELVNRRFNNEIVRALRLNVEIVIIDTFMSCFPMAIESVITSEIKGHFIIHIHVGCTDLYRSDSKCGPIIEQLGINGPESPDIAFHGDAKRKYKSLASISTENGNITDSIESNFRPHLVIAVSRSNGEQIGIESLFRTLEICVGFGSSIEDKTDTVADSTVTSTCADSTVTDEETVYEGVDPKTKDMNIKEFWTHLLERFNNNSTQAIKYLTGLGFKVIPFIKSRDVDKKLIIEKLVELSKDLFDKGYISKKISTEMFEADQQLYDNYLNCILTFSYQERPGAIYWLNKWAIEMRGTTLFINPENKKIIIFNFKLPRGPEVVTGVVEQTGIKTQDAGNPFDKEQLDAHQKILHGKPIKGYLTSKVDGSLLSITKYTGKTLELLVTIINIFGSEYIKLWMDMSLSISGGTSLLVPATHRSLMENGYMVDYMVTAMLVGGGITTRERLSGHTYLSAWKEYGAKFIMNMLAMDSFDDLSEVHTYLFEAVAKDRTSAFDTKIHDELAVKYSYDLLQYLGVSIAEKRFFVPYMIFDSKIPFDVPPFWIIEEGSQINKMMLDMEKIIFCEMTLKDFFARYIPSNKYLNIDQFIECFHPEGFIFMKRAVLPTEDKCHQSIDIIRTIYMKIKLRSYYIGHTFKVANLSYLFRLGKCAGHIFPLALAVYLFLTKTDMLNNICTEVLALFDFSDGSTLMNALAESNKKAIDEGRKPILANFEKRTLKAKICSAFATNNKTIDDIIFAIFVANTPAFVTDKRAEVLATFKKLLVDIKIWEPDCQTKLSELTFTDPVFSEFCAIYFK